MMMNTWKTQEKLKRRFTLPNELFSLELNSAEISIYAYLLYCEDRKTHQCWPSYKTISKAVNLSLKTVKKYVTELVDKGLISTENTTVITKKGIKRNGNLPSTPPRRAGRAFLLGGCNWAVLRCKVVGSKENQEEMSWLTAFLGGLPRWSRPKMEVNYE